jgi:signal transduction histidine kinase
MSTSEKASIEAQAKLDQLKDDFLSTVSHELQSPVTNIKMATQMLKILFQDDDMQASSITARLDSTLTSQQTTDISQCVGEALPSSLKIRAAHYIQILERECDKEVNLLSNFLDLQQLDAGTYAFSHTAIQLENWLPEILKPFLARIARQQQNLQVDVPDRLTDIITDPISLGRILGELLTNACKFTPPGGTIALTVLFPESMAFEGEETLQLKVTNTRVEIPAHELPRIFDRFYRLNSDRWEHGGTGLGLALVQKMTAYLGGTIVAESSGGKTSFTLTMPIHGVCLVKRPYA